MGAPALPLSDDLDIERFARFRKIVAAYEGKFEPPPTNRELEIAYLVVVENMSNGKLAACFSVAPQTISVQRHDFAIKLGFDGATRGVWHRLGSEYWRSVGRDEMQGATDA
jgi:hypothetical protein